MTPARLIVNGCSYMHFYAQGNGHGEIADQFGINQTLNLSQPGSCNNRIIRTTLKDSYETLYPTFYIIGTTFISRHELPMALGSTGPDGKWVSINTQGGIAGNHPLHEYFSMKDLKDYHNLWNRFTSFGTDDLIDDLQYRLLGMCDSLTSRGHGCVIFNTAEGIFDNIKDKSKLEPLRAQRQIIDGLLWSSIPWQLDQGAAWLPDDEHIYRDCRHVAPGQHKWLNQYLTNYIHEHKILE